ncbi:MAG: T4 RnlA family RNA ligase [Planctomycetes bacterium]|nr:T4 RnlA family RNA ligase [Planctomycetota bacterium]
MMHPARMMPFDVLWDGLQKAKAEREVSENVGHDGLRLYCYSESTVYDRKWNDITMLARGVILDPESKRVVATPFPKFFNVGERLDSIPDLPFETFEKLDGSLIILFQHKGEWRTATKGSLGSDQAKWAAAWISNHDLSCLDPETTYLAEAIYPENRIVVHYHHTGLVLLGAYRGDGTEVSYTDLRGLGERLGWRIAKRHSFTAVSELLALAKTLPPTEEGFVLRFSNGLRLKVKGDEYCRIHRLVSRLTPLAMWEAMQAGDDLETIRRQLPEEFWQDFDTIIALLHQQIEDLIAEVTAEAELVAHLSDKDVGLRLSTFPDRVRRFIFPYRKNNGDLLSSRTRDLVFREIRPDANRLDGYRPSSAVNRVIDEAA